MKKGFAKIIVLFVGVTVAVVLVGNVVLDTIFSVNQTGWDTASIALWAVVPIVVIASLILIALV